MGGGRERGEGEEGEKWEREEDTDKYEPNAFISIAYTLGLTYSIRIPVAHHLTAPTCPCSTLIQEPFATLHTLRVASLEPLTTVEREGGRRGGE